MIVSKSIVEYSVFNFLNIFNYQMFGRYRNSIFNFFWFIIILNSFNGGYIKFFVSRRCLIIIIIVEIIFKNIGNIEKCRMNFIEPFRFAYNVFFICKLISEYFWLDQRSLMKIWENIVLLSTFRLMQWGIVDFISNQIFFYCMSIFDIFVWY